MSSRTMALITSVSFKSIAMQTTGCKWWTRDIRKYKSPRFKAFTKAGAQEVKRQRTLGRGD